MVELELARFVVETDYNKLSPEVVKATKRNILDTLATALAGSAALGCREVVDLVTELGGRQESTLLVYGKRLPSPSAALANSTMAHALDYDDTHDQSVLHAGVTVVPAALAIAERVGGVSGKELIAAVALGIDLTCRMGIATKPWIGWILTSVYGYFGAATAAAKLLGLDVEGVLNAWGIAYAQASGNLECVASGALSKRLQAGFAAQGGVISALMAERGITGARESLGGKDGIFNLYQRGEYEPTALTAELGKRFEVVNLSYKSYPCCRWTHSGIDAASKLGQGISPDEIEEVEARVSEKAWQSIGEPMEVKRRPRNIVDAQFSIPYTMATALVKGTVGIDDFTEEAIKDPRILEIASKIKVAVSHVAQREREISGTEVTVKTRDGRFHSASVTEAKGHPKNPMSDEDFVRKFRDCALYAAQPLPPDSVNALLQLLADLEAATDVSQLARLTCGVKK